MPNSYEITGMESLLDGDSTPIEPAIDEETIVEPITETDVTTPTVDPDEPADPDTDPDIGEEDFLTSFLKEYGIQDGQTIVFKNEDESEESVQFNDLSNAEKLNILKELVNPNLTQDEIGVINYLRANNATIQDVIAYYSNKAVNDYINRSEPEYAVKDYSDDELYLADLKLKYPDMSEEDMLADLENAKQNEDLFAKKAGIIRQNFQKIEQEKEAKARTDRENQYNDFRKSVMEHISLFDTIDIDNSTGADQHVMKVEDSERDEISRYILQQDADGGTQFFKDMTDPAKIVQMAYFYKFGQKALSDLTQYFKNQLKTTRRQEKPVTTVRHTSDSKRKDNFSKNPNTVDGILGNHLL